MAKCQTYKHRKLICITADNGWNAYQQVTILQNQIQRIHDVVNLTLHLYMHNQFQRMW